MGAGQEKKPIKERIRANRTFLTILSHSVLLTSVFFPPGRSISNSCQKGT